MTTRPGRPQVTDAPPRVHQPATDSQVAALAQATRRSFAAAIRQLRTEAALTQAELARRSGCSRHTVYGVESGRTSASPWTLASLVAALDVSWADFLAHAIWHASDLNQRRRMARASVEPAVTADAMESSRNQAH